MGVEHQSSSHPTTSGLEVANESTDQRSQLPDQDRATQGTRGFCEWRVSPQIILVTRNENEFKRVPYLQLEVWDVVDF